VGCVAPGEKKKLTISSKKKKKSGIFENIKTVFEVVKLGEDFNNLNISVPGEDLNNLNISVPGEDLNNLNICVPGEDLNNLNICVPRHHYYEVRIVCKNCDLRIN
jgi:hypothetical protein